MSFLQFYSKTFFLLSLLYFINVLPLILADDDDYSLEKRQIGVLARTGALPQGKRSVEVLARNGELPYPGSRKDDGSEDTQDLLIEELEKAEGLSKLRAQALAEKIFEERELERFGTEKRSVAALARNGELPQKRLSETITRSGYLIKPPQEAVQTPLDILDPDDFLANEQSLIPQVLDERSSRTFLMTPKRSLGSAKNFLLDSRPNLYQKKNLASLARDGGFTSLRHPLMKERKLDGIFELGDIHGDDKKNVGALDKREILGGCRDKFQTYEPLDKGNNKERKREQLTAGSDYEDIWPVSISEGKEMWKRFLGRIPQLGRIHQKVQAPSTRRRPHLRPNWL